MKIKEIKKEMEGILEKYKKETLEIEGKEYETCIFYEDEALNLFEGFLFTEVKEKSELLNILRYKPPVSGYAVRVSVILYENQLYIKDFRRNRYLRRTIEKINKQFISKLKEMLENPTETNLSNVFDRTDVIEEFYLLYKKSREYLLRSLKGIRDEDERREFVDNFMMQMLTAWYLQEKGFFNNDRLYLVNKFKEIKQSKPIKNQFESYYQFLKYFFEKINIEHDKQYYEDCVVGKVVVGPAIFLDGKHSAEAISIPDDCFYKKDFTAYLINTPAKNVPGKVPILNLFESRDWGEGSIDEFVLGAIYEKLITSIERKKLGAYYTPEEITSYICKNTIEPYLVDRINEKFGEKFDSIEKIIENGKKDVLLYLFGLLKEIKICDPAVGSGHFLESAINVLVGIYEKIWYKLKEMGVEKGLEIVASDENGSIGQIDLLEISDEEQFKLYVKFFIILSKNIYGVDINPSALKVARARLFLTLAKHFDINKNYFIKFPNVHFNLREGNSLIGYLRFEKEKGEKKERETLGFYVSEQEAIKINLHLEAYLRDIAKALGIEEEIVEEVSNLNKILAKGDKISADDFYKVLRTKERLSRILIASLNSQYAKPLNEILNKITELFTDKLDAKFAKEHQIDITELKKIKTFHWLFEFPDVFLEKGGFDVVVGNPPHGGELDNEEIKLLKKTVFDSTETAILFILRSCNLGNKRCRFSLVIPKQYAYNDGWSVIREYMYNELKIEKIIDLGNAFKGQANEQIALLWKEKFEDFHGYLTGVFLNDRIIETGFVPKEFYVWMKRFPLGLDENEVKIGNYLFQMPFISLDFIKGYRGLPKSYSSNTGLICLEKRDIERNYILNPQNHVNEHRISERKLKEMKGEKIISQRIISFTVIPAPTLKIKAYRDVIGFLTFETVVNIYLETNRSSCLNYKLLTFLLNSNFASWYVQRFVYTKYFETSKDFDIKYIKQYKIPDIKLEGSRVLSFFCDYLHYLNATEERRKHEERTIRYFHSCLGDSLVYELYFKEKFHEDCLYEEPKEYLTELVSKHLKPINYDRWAQLYWKKVLGNNLTSEEEAELEKLDKENLMTIQEVYQKLSQDKEIQRMLEKINSHPWVKKIEGEGTDCIRENSQREIQVIAEQARETVF